MTITHTSGSLCYSPYLRIPRYPRAKSNAQAGQKPCQDNFAYLRDSEIKNCDLDLHLAVGSFNQHHVLRTQRAMNKVAAKTRNIAFTQQQGRFYWCNTQSTNCWDPLSKAQVRLVITVYSACNCVSRSITSLSRACHVGMPFRCICRALQSATPPQMVSLVRACLAVRVGECESDLPRITVSTQVS